MRIAVLTTEAISHARFVSALAREREVVGVLVETIQPPPPFETSHPFETDREAFERESWFPEKVPLLSELASTVHFSTLSAPEAVAHLKSLRADLAFILGARTINRQILDVLGRGLLNLHGADPQDYQGADPELWAVYHQDFAGLMATAHFVEDEVKAGAVLDRQPVNLRRGMGLHELRYAQTEAFISVAESAADAMSGRTMRMIIPLQRQGRRYGPMPRVLKDVCVGQFRRHAEALP